MTVSEMIKKLEFIKTQCGNVEIKVIQAQFSDEPICLFPLYNKIEVVDVELTDGHGMTSIAKSLIFSE